MDQIEEDKFCFVLKDKVFAITFDKKGFTIEVLCGQVSISPTCLRTANKCEDPKSTKRQSSGFLSFWDLHT